MDNYVDGSPKEQTRKTRGLHKSHGVIKIIPVCWSDYLSVTQNKKNLVTFLKSLVDEVAVKEILLQGESLTYGGKTMHEEDTDVFILLIHFMHKWQIAGLKVY